ncbi:unnamed protein product, partial [Heterotrigona itama]
ECSGTSYEENENELSQNEDEIEIPKLDESGQTEKSSDSEVGNFRNFRRSRKRIRIPSDSKSENDANIPRSSQNLDAFCDTEIGIDETIWKKLEVGGSSGRPLIHTIFKNVAGPTSSAKIC